MIKKRSSRVAVWKKVQLNSFVRVGARRALAPMAGTLTMRVLEAEYEAAYVEPPLNSYCRHTAR